MADVWCTEVRPGVAGNSQRWVSGAGRGGATYLDHMTMEAPVTGPQPSPFVNVNGLHLPYVYYNGLWWVAAKPIIVALGLDWTFYFDRLKADPLLHDKVGLQTFVAKDLKKRRMLCVQHPWTLGFVMSLRPRDRKLVAVQQAIYNALFEHYDKEGLEIMN